MNVSYSVWFNRKYGRFGPLFRGRFKSRYARSPRGPEDQPLYPLNPVKVAALQLEEAAALGR